MWQVTWQDGKDPGNPAHENAICADGGIASGTAKRTRECPKPDLASDACPLKEGCIKEDIRSIYQIIDCPIPGQAVTSKCECNLFFTRELCKDPVSASGDTYPSINSYCICDEVQVQFTDTNSDGNISVQEKKEQVETTCSSTQRRDMTEAVLCPIHPGDTGVSTAAHASVHTDVIYHDHCHHEHVSSQGVVDPDTMASDCRPLPYDGWTSHTHSQGPYTLDSYSNSVSCQLKSDGITCKCDVTLN